MSEIIHEWDGVAAERDVLRAANNDLRIENARLRKMLVQAPEYLESAKIFRAAVEMSALEATEAMRDRCEAIARGASDAWGRGGDGVSDRVAETVARHIAEAIAALREKADAP